MCEQLHFFLQEAFPAEYDQRELDTKGMRTVLSMFHFLARVTILLISVFGSIAEEEVSNGVYSLELQCLHRHQHQVPLQTWGTMVQRGINSGAALTYNQYAGPCQYTLDTRLL